MEITKEDQFLQRELKSNLKIVVMGQQSSGKNSLAVLLSEQAIGKEPQIIASIIVKPRPSAFEGKHKYFDELILH